MRRKPDIENDDLNIWVAFTDLMSNLFLIVSLFLIISLLVNASASKSKKGEMKAAKDLKMELEEKLNNLEKRNQNLQQEIDKLKSIIPKTSDTPPIIFLRDSGTIRFNSGSAGLQTQEMLREFDKKDGLIDVIENNAKSYGINLVEIIGHTDPKPLGSLTSNLDTDNKIAKTANNFNIDVITVDKELIAGSNADLGLMRAVEIVRILRYHQKNNGRLQGLEFRAYSAAQLVPPKLPNNAPAKDDDKRRIEIRFTRLDENNAIRR
jgi:flagellar motor protein MotB